MPLDPRKVRACLENKLKCEVRDTHHTYFDLVVGSKVIATTRLSHSSGQLGDGLTSAMAKQLGVSAKVFRDCVSCTVDRDRFIKASRHNPAR